MLAKACKQNRGNAFLPLTASVVMGIRSDVFAVYIRLVHGLCSQETGAPRKDESCFN